MDRRETTFEGIIGEPNTASNVEDRELAGLPELALGKLTQQPGFHIREETDVLA
jgi:hypothetical protein